MSLYTFGRSRAPSDFPKPQVFPGETIDPVKMISMQIKSGIIAYAHFWKSRIHTFQKLHRPRNNLLGTLDPSFSEKLVSISPKLILEVCRRHAFSKSAELTFSQIQMCRNPICLIMWSPISAEYTPSLKLYSFAERDLCVNVLIEREHRSNGPGVQVQIRNLLQALYIRAWALV